MANDNNEPVNLPGGETLNDRLKRAAAMAREHRGGAQAAPRQETPRQEAPRQEAPRQEAPRNEEPRRSPAPEASPVSDSYLYGDRGSRREEATAPEAPRGPRYEEPRNPGRRPGERPHRRGDEYMDASPERNPGKKGVKWVIVLAVALALAVLAVVFLTVSNTRRNAEYQQQVEQLQLANEQLQLSNEYDALNNEFAQYENQTSLLANDSIVQKYSAARAQVEKLLQELKNEKNKSAAQIGKLKDEIATLKGILRNYVEQINALNQENQELRTENQEVKARNQQLAANIQTVQQSNKVLNERMTLAEKLNVTGVNLMPLNKKGKKEKNVTKARQLMVTFTIPQNNSTPVGEKTIWLRITNPEGDLLSGGGSFQFEGATLPATARKSIEYAGEEIGGITIYWDVNTTLTPGDYTVELFCDNYRLASRRFTLKK